MSSSGIRFKCAPGLLLVIKPGAQAGMISASHGKSDWLGVSLASNGAGSDRGGLALP